MQRIGCQRAGMPGNIDCWVTLLTTLPVDLDAPKIALMPCSSETHAHVSSNTNVCEN